MSDIIFKIGPRINASGRIQNGKEAVDLLIEKDFPLALQKARLINQYNETRKDLDKSMTEEANKIVDQLENLSQRRSIVIYNEAWHKGVIGIVASRLTEIYYRPAVVLTRTNDLATGSARSVSGFDVYKAIEYCRDLLENFGGHTYAAGLSMKVGNVAEFTRRFEEYVTKHILPEQTSATIDIDAQLDFRDITSKFFFRLEEIQSFWTGKSEADVLHDECFRLRNEQSGRQRPGTHQTGIGGQQIEQRDERHCVRAKLASPFYQDQTIVQHLLHH